MFLDAEKNEESNRAVIRDLTCRLGTQSIVIEVMCKSNSTLQELADYQHKQLVEFEDTINEFWGLKSNYSKVFVN